MFSGVPHEVLDFSSGSVDMASRPLDSGHAPAHTCMCACVNGHDSYSKRGKLHQQSRALSSICAQGNLCSNVHTCVNFFVHRHMSSTQWAGSHVKAMGFAPMSTSASGNPKILYTRSIESRVESRQIYLILQTVCCTHVSKFTKSSAT